MQLISLAELILDGHYRTFTGFQILIEKVLAGGGAPPSSNWRIGMAFLRAQVR